MENKEMSPEEIIKFLLDKNTARVDHSFDEVEIPFKIKPNEYLTFAEKDIINNTKHGRINGLSNAKRALDCRVESILISFGLHSLAKKNNWNIPKKLDELLSLGIVTPRILLKLNKARNLIEHEFECPELSVVEDFIDIVSLFLESTKVFLFNIPNDIEYENEKLNEFIMLKFDRYAEEFILSNINTSERINIKDKEYLILVKLYAKTINDMYT